MIKKEGLHFYINIINYYDIIEKEEEETGSVQHSIHELDTFFTMIERYAKSTNHKLEIEKITGSRLHLYIVDELEDVLESTWNISKYSVSLAKLLSEQVGKYKTLNKFRVQIGACYGSFCEFIFKDNGYEELTSIGYAANFAAKLQSLTKENHLSVSENLYDAIKSVNVKKQMQKVYSPTLKKYSQNCYYEILLRESNKHFNEERFTDAIDYANNLNLGDIEFTTANKLISFDNLSVSVCKKLYGIPLYADIRGFTKMFHKDDSNLEEMKIQTQNILFEMYKIIKSNNGVHIQFQGDREVALFHDYGEYNCYLQAVTAGLKLLDKIENSSISIGIGESYGKLFATKIGARGYKDNILLGNTVSEADYLEDLCANENELVISLSLYDQLLKHEKNLARIFEKRDDYYVTYYGYKSYLKNSQYSYLDENNKKSNYNGAWGK
ncbi:MAG: hypothetical protein WC006_07715 [Bacilli bacterium]